MPGQFLECKNRHRNPPHAKFCGVCGSRLHALDGRVEAPLEGGTLFLAMGGVGGDILLEYHKQFKPPEEPKNNFLILDASVRELRRLAGAFPPSCVRRVGEVSWDWKASEKAALEDPLIGHHLKRGAGDVESLFTVVPLGEGVGSGAGPYLLSYAFELGLKAERLALALLPSDEEPDLSHFNAFCGLSRLINYRGRRNVDLLIVASNTNLEMYKSVDAQGNILTRSQMLAAIIEFIAQPPRGEVYRWVGLPELAQMGKLTGIIHCIPCLALNHSLKLYGSLTNILDNALLRPLVNMRRETTLYSHLFLRVPKRMMWKAAAEHLSAEFNAWKEENFPNEISGDYSLVYTEEKSDRVSALLLAGGTDMADFMGRTVDGYSRIKQEIVSRGQETTNRTAAHLTFVSIDELKAVEEVLNRYSIAVRERKPALTTERGIPK